MRLSSILCVVLSVANLLAAEPLSSSDAPQADMKTPVISVYSGNHAVNSVPNKDAFAPVVRILTPQGAPISGVAVRFELPDTNVGYYGNHQATFETTTDNKGFATARGYVPAKIGPVTIKATATHEGAVISATVFQRNGKQPQVITVEEKKSRASSLGNKWLLLGVAVVVGIVVAVVATRSSSTGTIKLGTPTVGGGA